MDKRAVALLLVIGLLGLLASSAEAQVGRGKFGLGLRASGNLLQADWPTKDPGYGAAAELSYSLGHNWGLLSSLGFDAFSGKAFTANQKVLSTAFYGDLALSFDFLPNKILNPFVYGGGGLTFYDPRVEGGAGLLTGKNRPWDGYIFGGIGFDYFLDESWSIIVSAEVVNMASDGLDGMIGGSGKDQFGRVSVGIRYYLFDRASVQRIVDSLGK